MTDNDKPRLEKFKDAVRERGADEDEKRWDDRLKPAPGKSE